MGRLILAAAFGAVLLAGCATDGATPPQVHADGGAVYDDPPVGTLIRRKGTSAKSGVGQVDAQALDNLRNMDNGRMNGQ